ncbi:MAG: hypothetical protein GEV08_10445 [Acidimicrobiia bacterium]|nr:hypothetical protein [Acidimicrobiia bacterium]
MPAPPRTGDPQVDAVVAWLFELGATVVSVGHGRDPRSRASAARFVEAWRGLGRLDEREAFARDVDAVVDWPATAASWLRPAQRLVAGAPDAWVVADTPASWAPMARRLRLSTSWAPARTVCFPALATPALPELAGHDATEGLRGVGTDGTRWQFTDGALAWHATPTGEEGGP